MSTKPDTLTRIDVVVGYDDETAGKSFDPSTALRKVERWAADALEAPIKVPHRLALRYTDTALEPSENKTLVELDANADGELRFDLHVETLRFDIFVNGQPRTVTERRISFDQVVALAGGSTSNSNTLYTVTYSRGPKANPKGSMVQGDIVKVKDNMRFNATPTDKS